jgi:hypothetical protein
MSWLIRLASAGCLLACIPSTASAYLTVCSKYSRHMLLALAYEEGGSLTTKGWFGIAPGACTRLILRAAPRYYRFESVTFAGASSGAMRDALPGRNAKPDWPRLSVTNSSFSFTDATRAHAGARQEPFIPFDVQGTPSPFLVNDIDIRIDLAEDGTLTAGSTVALAPIPLREKRPGR